MMDGVYQIARNGAAVFHPVPAPTDADVATVIERVFREVARKLDARGDDDGAGFASAEPVLATLAGASVAVGESANPPLVAGPRAPPREDSEAEQRQPDLLDLGSRDDASS